MRFRKQNTLFTLIQEITSMDKIKVTSLSNT